ncbi:hypothetical protein H6G81_14075 [Scytonema hofmannii FACHB-248]|uniref:Uncharacterized protein n=1 Tax=Scytonema hofmannii FACHB-248 TaxID=1842502 RepID=A0ABR8GR05_9CYAN|nr:MULTISPECIES: hypothetical protein [Nostocales]MBD2605624.1 hypothetical protein [Scytonema hofmannii FACHB-248]
MQSIKLCSHVGADGLLHLDIPTGIVTGDIEVEVIIRPINPSPREWMPGFFEEVIGGWVGELLERPEQGEFETREKLF